LKERDSSFKQSKYEEIIKKLETEVEKAYTNIEVAQRAQ
jgi:hypothetical protein